MENIRPGNWVVYGLLWGSFMFLTMSIILPLLDDVHLDGIRIIKSLVIWLVMGLAFGYIMKRFGQR